MSTIDEIQAALKELENEPMVTGVFTWRDVDYPAVVSSQKRSKTIEAGGWNVDAAIVLIVRRGLFGEEIPEEKQRITYRGTRYTIDEIVTPPGEPFLKLLCS